MTGTAERRVPDGSGLVATLRPVALLFPIVFVTVQAWRLRWTDDDGFINFRVLDQLFAGHGPVYNAGQRVEAFTSPLYIGLMALLRVITLGHVDDGWLAVVLGLVGLAAGMVGALKGATIVRGRLGGSTEVWPLGLLVVAALPPMWEYGTAGLETGMAIGWVGLSFWLLARQLQPQKPVLTWLRTRFANDDAPERGTWGPGRTPTWVAVVLGLGPLVRPEMAISSVLLIGALLAVTPASRRKPLRLVGSALALPIAWQIFRMGFYGSLVPNTALAKAAGSSRWGQGWFYVANTVVPYALGVPVVAAGLWWVAGWRRRSTGDTIHASRFSPAHIVAAVPALSGLVLGLYVMRVGGDYMHARMLLVPIFSLCCPVAAVEVSGTRVATAVRAAAVGVVAGWAVIAVHWLHAPPPKSPGAHAVADQRAFWVGLAGNPHPVTLSQWTRSPIWQAGNEARIEQAHHSDVMLIVVPELASQITQTFGRDQAFLLNRGRGTFTFYSGIGVAGLQAGRGVQVLDFHGLADPYASRLPILRPRGLPGHEHQLPLALAAAEAGVAPLQASADSAAWTRALECGQLAEIRRAVSGPLTLARFWDNLVASPSLTFRSLPADPYAATKGC